MIGCFDLYIYIYIYFHQDYEPYSPLLQLSSPDLIFFSAFDHKALLGSLILLCEDLMLFVFDFRQFFLKKGGLNIGPITRLG